MMQEALVELRDKLQSALGSRCKSYFAGKRGYPYKNSLPALTVYPAETSMERQSTNTDMYRHRVVVQVVVDMVPHFQAGGNPSDISASSETLTKIMEEADTDGAPKINTVLGCLMRKSNMTGTNYTYNITPRVNYQGAEPAGYFYVAAEVELDLISNFVPRKA